MEEKKILENELDKVAGGQETAEQAVNKPIVSQKAFDEMRAVLEEDLPVAVCDELGRTKSDVEFCRLLAENGIDVQKLQRKIPDEVLSRIGGGNENLSGTKICCPNCENSDSGEISVQVLSSAFSNNSKYRCCKCGCYFKQELNGNCVEIK